ncbi:MAG: hypothetical protein K2Y23_10650 [Cyanobacteria bacterium]|nr:hypothetical protein [Cyanobacteriota bacterium]
MTSRLAATIVFSCLCTAAGAQTAAPNLTRQQRDLLKAIVSAVDTAAPGETADLKWQHHVLRASDGSHYIAFSAEPAPDMLTGRAVMVYVRLATVPTPGAAPRIERSAVQEWLNGSSIDPRLQPQRRGVAIGDMPALGAGAMGVRGAASVGSPDLQAMDLERQRARERRDDEERRRKARLEGAGDRESDRLPFEDFDVVPSAVQADGTRAIHRALTAGPGEYVLTLAWADAAQPAARAAVHVARRALRLGPAIAAELSLSTIIVADRIAVRPAAYSPIEQRAHPYAIGLTEIVPARDTILTPVDDIAVAFQIVNAQPSASGKPDVHVSPRIVRITGMREEAVASLSPLTYDASTVPPDFDLRLGHPLLAAMSAPLATIPRGHYRLLIAVEDRIAHTVVAGATEFTVVGTPETLLAEAPPLAGRFDPATVLAPATLTKILDHLAPPASSPGLTQALEAARAGRYAELLVAPPSSAGEGGVAAVMHGIALLSLRDLGATAQFERALRESAQGTAAIHVLLGAARAIQNRDSDAVAAWLRARADGVSPAVVDPLIAAAYLRQKDFARAAAAIPDERAADSVASAKLVAATRLAAQRASEAVAIIDQALAGGSDDPGDRWLLVHALYADWVGGNRRHRDRLVAELRRYVEARGLHAALAGEWLTVVMAA